MSRLFGNRKIINVPLPLANTEVPIALPLFATKVLIQPRGAYEIKVALEEGKSGVTYFTAHQAPKPPLKLEGMIGGMAGVRTIYVQSSAVGAVVEVIAYS